MATGTPNPLAATAQVAQPGQVPSGPSVAELMRQMEVMREQMSALMGAAKPAVREVVEKEYFHQTPGSSIVVDHKGPQGEHLPERLFFDYRGSLVTSDPDVQDFLDPIADKPGVPIYTHKAPAVNSDAQKAAAEVIKSAAISIDKLGSEVSRAQA